MIKQFTLVIVGDQISTTGNMNLNEVASTLITLAYGQGQQDAPPKTTDPTDEPSSPRSMLR